MARAAGRSDEGDCGEYERCGGCEANFCSEECAKLQCSKPKGECLYESQEEDGCDDCTCVLCRKEWATDGQLLAWLLRRDGLTRAKALEMYRSEGVTL